MSGERGAGLVLCEENYAGFFFPILCKALLFGFVPEQQSIQPNLDWSFGYPLGWMVTKKQELACFMFDFACLLCPLLERVLCYSYKPILCTRYQQMWVFSTGLRFEFFWTQQIMKLHSILLSCLQHWNEHNVDLEKRTPNRQSCLNLQYLCLMVAVKKMCLENINAVILGMLHSTFETKQ